MSRKTFSFLTTSNTLKYCYNVVFLFHCFMIITAFRYLSNLILYFKILIQFCEIKQVLKFKGVRYCKDIEIRQLVCDEYLPLSTEYKTLFRKFKKVSICINAISFNFMGVFAKMKGRLML